MLMPSSITLVAMDTENEENGHVSVIVHVQADDHYLARLNRDTMALDRYFLIDDERVALECARMVSIRE